MLNIIPSIALGLLFITSEVYGAKTCPPGKHLAPKPKPSKPSTPVPAGPKTYTCPGGQTTKNPTCCAFVPLRDDLQKNLFQNTCGEDVHEVLRLSFHDAAGFSKTGAFKGHGADGSMIVFSDIETSYGANTGIEDSVDDLKPYLARYNVSAGDLIQFAAAVGITNCPGAPKLQFLAGRPNPTIPAEDGSLPEPQQSVTEIIARTVDMGLEAVDMVNLLASHSIGKADHVIPGHEGVAFDSTPEVFDTQFYLETMLKGTGWAYGVDGLGGTVESALYEDGVMRLESDYAFAHDARTACQWQSFVGNQELMMSAFAGSMAKMAVIGQDTKDFIDCSDIIPTPQAPLTQAAYYPSGYTKTDVVQSCRFPLPKLSVASA